jgi:hypothetical protein
MAHQPCRRRLESLNPTIRVIREGVGLAMTPEGPGIYFVNYRVLPVDDGHLHSDDREGTSRSKWRDAALVAMTCGLILLLGSARILMPQVVGCSSTRGPSRRNAWPRGRMLTRN